MSFTNLAFFSVVASSPNLSTFFTLQNYEIICKHANLPMCEQKKCISTLDSKFHSKFFQTNFVSLQFNVLICK